MRCAKSVEHPVAPSGSAAELDDPSAIAFGWPASRQFFKLLHGSALRCYFLAELPTGVCFAVERLRDGGGATHFAEQQDLDLKIAALVADSQLVSNADLASGLGGLAVALNAAEIAGACSQGPGLEKSRGPKPFVHSHGVHELFLKVFACSIL